MNLRTMFLVALIFSFSLILVSSAFAEYQIGQHVNNFTLPDAFGNSVSLYDYQDRIVIVSFWFTG